MFLQVLKIEVLFFFLKKFLIASLVGYVGVGCLDGEPNA